MKLLGNERIGEEGQNIGDKIGEMNQVAKIKGTDGRCLGWPVVGGT